MPLTKYIVRAVNLDSTLRHDHSTLSMSHIDGENGTGTCSIQIVDAVGDNIAMRHLVELWCSDTAYGDSDGITAFAVGTGLELHEFIQNKYIKVLSDATGLIVMNCTIAGGGTTYIMAADHSMVYVEQVDITS